ncbi:hypothetical protein ACFQ0B_54270 [Nonomuraea thailandensis]
MSAPVQASAGIGPEDAGGAGEQPEEAADGRLTLRPAAAFDPAQAEAVQVDGVPPAADS